MSAASLTSIIIPSYNYARHLPTATASALEQGDDNHDIEVIIVDDGSTDATPEIARSMAGKWGERLRYIRQDNQGLSAARNTGMTAARGDYLLFLDADDLLGAGCVTSQTANLAAHPELDVSVCLCLLAFPPDEAGPCLTPWHLRAAHLDLHLCCRNISPAHTFLIRAEAARDTGLFDTTLGACEDQDFWLRCAADGKRFGPNPDALVFYRRHRDSMSSSDRRQLAHDGTLRFRISELLRNSPHFPRAGSFLGWLAHAAGTGGSALNAANLLPELGARLLDEAARAMLCSAKFAARASAADPHLAAAETYFAARCMSIARNCRGATPELMEKALRYLERRYPRLAAQDNESLGDRQTRMLARINCDDDRARETMQKALLSPPAGLLELYPNGQIQNALNKIAAMAQMT